VPIFSTAALRGVEQDHFFKFGKAKSRAARSGKITRRNIQPRAVFFGACEPEQLKLLWSFENRSFSIFSG
jgi:hypothetical protein